MASEYRAQAAYFPGVSSFLQLFAVNLTELKVNFTQSQKRGNVGCWEGMALKSEVQTDLEPSKHYERTTAPATQSYRSMGPMALSQKAGW